jgi:hypothetical protein
MNDEYPNNEYELEDQLYRELRRISGLMLESTDETERRQLNLKLVEIQKEINELPNNLDLNIYYI